MQGLSPSTGQLMEFLHSTPLFARVEPAVVAEIAPELEYVRLDAGAIVIHEGDDGDGLYLVLDGRLRAVAHTLDGAEIFLNEIAAGESVGEIALLTGERRTATVYATTAAELLWLSRAQFDMLGQRYPAAADAIAESIIQRLQQTQLNLALHVGKLFEHLDEPVRRALRTELELVLLRGGAVLVRQGAPSDALYLVINGRLRVVLEQAEGTTSTLYELRRGQTVGEIGILTGGPRTATVYAVRDTLLARLPRAGFERLLAAYPQAMVQQFAAPVINVLQDQTNRARRPDNAVVTIGQIMMRVAIINDAQHMRTARGLADYYMRLELGSYGMLEFGALDQIVAAGYQSAQAIIATWQKDATFQALKKG